MAGSIESDDGDVGFQIAPMVDVVFVLMLFFMASAGMQIVETSIGLHLPSGRSSVSQGPPPTPLVIAISADGQVSMNNQVYGGPKDKRLPALRDKLKAINKQFGDKDPVIIRPVDAAREERVIDVLDAAAASGVKNLTFG